MIKPQTRSIMVDPDRPDELVLDLGMELCEQLGWQPGDTLEWVDLKDGTWQLRRIQSLTL